MMFRPKAIMLLLFAVTATPSSAQLSRNLSELDGVGIEEQLDAAIPPNLTFLDSRGQRVRLGDLFDGERPVILSLNYSDCPLLCQLQLNGLVTTLREMKWSVGEHFDVVSVSINPLETSARARQSKQRYVRDYGRASTADGWHFLTGDSKSIEKLASVVGFKYRYVPERKEYAHAAAIMVCTPDGRLSRYLYGVVYPKRTLRLSLVEAGEGKIGSSLDRVLLYCFHYDATVGRYAPVARQLMRLGAGITLLLISMALVPYWLRRRSVTVKADLVRPQASL